jgi:hypothetical protein
MQLGAGYTVEEQITGQAERGGLQIQVYPMRPEIYENEIKTKVLRPMSCAAVLHPDVGLSQLWAWRPAVRGANKPIPNTSDSRLGTAAIPAAVLFISAIRLSGKVSPANVRRIHLQQLRVSRKPFQFGIKDIG